MWVQGGYFFYPQFVKRENVWYFWMQVEGDPKVACKWRFSAKTENVESGIRMEFSGTVLPVDLRVSEAIESEECLLMKKKNVEKLMNKNDIVISFNVLRI